MTCTTDAIGLTRGPRPQFPYNLSKVLNNERLIYWILWFEIRPPPFRLVTFKTGLPQQQMWTHLAAKAKQPDEVLSIPLLLSQSEGSGFITYITRKCNWTTFVNAAAIAYRQNPAPLPWLSRHAIVARFKRVVRVRVLVSGNMHLKALILLHSRLTSENKKTQPLLHFQILYAR